MIPYNKILVDDTIYIIHSNPYIVLEYDVLQKVYKDGQDRLKLLGGGLTFEIEYCMVEGVYIDKDEATADMLVIIKDKVDELIIDLTDNHIKDYYQLDKMLEFSKNKFPEKFI